MPWKTEIDRLVNRSLLDAAKGGGNDSARALKTVQDLLELAPDRIESHFHVGTAAEMLGEAADDLPASEGEALRWRHLGALDAAARRGERDRVNELVQEDAFQDSLAHPEGRMALRAVGRMLLRGGRDEEVFGYYVTHLKAVEDEAKARAEQRPPRRYYRITPVGNEAMEEVVARFPALVRVFTPDPKKA